MQTYVSGEKCIRVKYSLRSSHLSPRDLHISAVVYFPTCASASERCARKYSILSPNKPSNLFIRKKRNCKKKKITRINEYRSTRFSQNKKVQAWNIVERFLEKLSNINLRSKFVYLSFCFSLSTLELLKFLTRDYCYEKVYIVTKYFVISFFSIIFNFEKAHF